MNKDFTNTRGNYIFDNIEYDILCKIQQYNEQEKYNPNNRLSYKKEYKMELYDQYKVENVHTKDSPEIKKTVIHKELPVCITSNSNSVLPNKIHQRNEPSLTQDVDVSTNGQLWLVDVGTTNVAVNSFNPIVTMCRLGAMTRTIEHLNKKQYGNVDKNQYEDYMQRRKTGNKEGFKGFQK